MRSRSGLSSRAGRWLIAGVALLSAASLVAIYLYATPSTPGCSGCADTSTLPGILGLSPPTSSARSGHHWYNSTVLWTNRSIPMEDLAFDVVNLSTGESIVPNANWSLTVVPGGGSASIAAYDWLNDTPGWLTGGGVPVLRGMVFVLDSGGFESLAGFSWIFYGTSANPGGEIVLALP